MKVALCHVGIRHIGFDAFYKIFSPGFDHVESYHVDSYLVSNGMTSIGASLLKRGHEVVYVDLRMLGSWEDVEDSLSKAKVEMVGCGFQTPNREYALKLCRIAKSMGLVTVVGGPHVTCAPEDILGCDEVDHLVVGEGELTLPAICDTYDAGGKPERLIEAEMVKDLSSLDLPYLSPLYENVVKLKKCGFIVTSRGCPGRCYYCQPVMKKIYGNKIKFRSLDHVFKELDMYIHKLGIRKFYIMDDMFTTKKERVLEFTSRLRSQGYNIEYDINARVDFFDEEMAYELASTGCGLVSFGFESGSNKKLKLINKHTTREKNLEIGKLWKKTGKQVTANILVGIPGETEDDLAQDYSFIEELGPDRLLFNYMVPYPGTEFFNILSKQGALSTTDFGRYEMNLNKQFGTVKGVDYDMLHRWEPKFDKLRKKIFMKKCMRLLLKNPKLLFGQLMNYTLRDLANKLKTLYVGTP
ncbi:MAG: B12-binding domain-containing radical SAM protein [Deltaproteobacteria bacterium]|nr:B12-binding domain-containing radical SAM protein [Deltaproteobacteria bacterium]